MLNCIFTWDNSIDLITVVIGLLTLWIAIRVHKTFVKNNAKSKQVEEMSKLVQELNETIINLKFWKRLEQNNSLESTDCNLNIFKIGDLLKKKNQDEKKAFNDYNEFNSYKVALEGYDNIFNIESFIFNPFIPKRIADELRKFYNSSYPKIDFEPLNNFVTASDKFELQGKMTHDSFDFSNYRFGDALALESWINLKTHSYELSKIIAKWFRKHGIKDFNIWLD